jgi:Cd2+/Zn2+-exporting ATPase
MASDSSNDLPNHGDGAVSPGKRGVAAPEWVERLTAFLAGEAQVEAILVQPESHKVSLAILGDVDEAKLHERLDAVLRRLDEKTLDRGVSAAVDAAGADLGGVRMRQLPNEMLLEKPTCPTAPMLWQWRQFKWPEPEELEAQSEEEWKALAVQASICGVSLVAAWICGRIEAVAEWVIIVLYIVAIIAGAWDAAIDAWAKLKQGTLDIHFLMLAVAVGAVAIGHWNEGALLLFLFSLSGALEHYALHRTHREINSLTKAAPKRARVLVDNGEEVDRDVVDLVPGDLLRVRPDEMFAVDGELIEGETSADESNLTGEAAPVDKQPGDIVFSGTLNLWGLATVKVTRAAAESSLQRIIDLIQRAQHLRAPSQRFTDKFGTRYTYGVLGLTAVMFLVWWLGFGVPAFANPQGDKGGFSAFYRAMTLLVVASPCALVLSIPSAILAAIAWSAKKGVLFRGGAAIEKLAEVDTVALDKTGTLTTGELVVHEVESFPAGREKDVAEIALTLEENSNHPIARAITAYGVREGLEGRQLSEFQSITGQGLRGKVDEQVCYLGRRELMQSGEFDEWMAEVPEPPMEFSEVWVVYNDVMGRILLKDEIRKESAAVLRTLSEAGIRTLMLTGDRRSAAETVAEKLGVDEVRAGLHPEDKVEAIDALNKAGRKTAMVGDGVNDAPSLAAAWVSVAMGGRGSDAAMEQADVVLMKDRIEKLLTAWTISRRARAVIRQNLAISLGTVVLMVGASLFGIVPLTIGVLMHEGSTVLVCLNSLRLLFGKE